MISGNAFIGIHGLHGDRNINYDYITKEDKKVLQLLIVKCIETGYVDERLIAEWMNCGMIEAIEYKNKLKYLRVIHTNGGFCVPCVLNYWDISEVKNTTWRELINKYTDEWSHHTDDQILKHDRINIR